MGRTRGKEEINTDKNIIAKIEFVEINCVIRRMNFLLKQNLTANFKGILLKENSLSLANIVCCCSATPSLL